MVTRLIHSNHNNNHTISSCCYLHLLLLLPPSSSSSSFFFFLLLLPLLLLLPRTNNTTQVSNQMFLTLLPWEPSYTRYLMNATRRLLHIPYPSILPQNHRKSFCSFHNPHSNFNALTTTNSYCCKHISIPC